MAKARGKTPEISVHPFFESANRQEATDSVTFMGYCGPSTGNGSMVLYASLNELADCIEVPSEDVLHVEDVPEAVLPFGAKRIWIRSKAKITRRRTGDAEDMTPALGNRKLVAISKGRLKMLTRIRSARDDACGNCISMCSLCISPCNCRECSSECKALEE
ncbi:hypothetical protein [Mesorhizobium marinum]|uniref:Uncharacterized protein n=1 Tax=Mesorhizobium marinum TaxID=3228790 RepID=A0ABV3QZU8_9HYPH